MSRETQAEFEARMRREIRKFYKQNPAAFRDLIKEYEVWAVEARGRGRPPIPDRVLAALLAEWEVAKAAKVRKPEFLAEAAKGWKWQTRNRKGSMMNEETIAEHIKTAQRRARENPKFRACVDQLAAVVSFGVVPSEWRFIGGRYVDEGGKRIFHRRKK